MHPSAEAESWEYRALYLWIKRGGITDDYIDPERVDQVERADGTKTKTFMVIWDIESGVKRIPNEQREKDDGFRIRGRQIAIDHLNRLGREGWRVVGWANRGEVVAADLPFGSYLLMRRRVDG